MIDLHVWHLGCIGDQEVEVVGVEQLPVLVIDELLVERATDALRDTAINLSLHNLWIDQPATVMHNGVLAYLDDAGLHIDFDNSRVHTIGKGSVWRAKVAHGL